MSPVVVDLTSADKPSSSARDQQQGKALLESVAQFRAQLRRAKQDGIFLSLSKDHVDSLRRREVVSRFLIEMRRLRDAETVATYIPVAEASGKDDNDVGGEEGYEDKDKQDGPVSRYTAKEASRLKRKGFAFNPVCKNCKLQFDMDDNKLTSCAYHAGTLEAQLNDEFWADTDDCMVSDEFADENPEAYKWTCCSGDAHALPCVVDKHIEGDKSKMLRT